VAIRRTRRALRQSNAGSRNELNNFVALGIAKCVFETVVCFRLSLIFCVAMCDEDGVSKACRSDVGGQVGT
jgi:hypothetical protein